MGMLHDEDNTMRSSDHMRTREHDIVVIVMVALCGE
jgi:hypothetical protein